MIFNHYKKSLGKTMKTKGKLTKTPKKIQKFNWKAEQLDLYRTQY